MDPFHPPCNCGSYPGDVCPNPTQCGFTKNRGVSVTAPSQSPPLSLAREQGNSRRPATTLCTGCPVRLDDGRRGLVTRPAPGTFKKEFFVYLLDTATLISVDVSKISIDERAARRLVEFLSNQEVPRHGDGSG